jgi:predicted double-glycine peptidase
VSEKQAGGDILGRLAGLVSRPFVGAAKSQAIQNKVVGGITRHVNEPIENGLRRVGVHKAISKAYEYGTTPIPHTPRFLQPIMSDPAQRRAYGNWRADDLVHTFAHNPEIVGALAIPAPGVAETYLAGKHLASKAFGGVKKLAGVADSFSDELQKIANGDMLQYFQDHPEKLEEKRRRDQRKKKGLVSTGLVKEAEVSPYQQKTQWTCSAACLKAVMAHHGVKMPELKLIEAIGARKGRGAECDQIAAAARKLGFAAFEYSFASIEQAKILLDQQIPIICDIQSFNNPGKGHYVVLVAANDDSVELMDPNTPGNWRVISKKEMDDRWWDRAMAPPHDMMPKWGIVIVPNEGVPNEG